MEKKKVFKIFAFILIIIFLFTGCHKNKTNPYSISYDVNGGKILGDFTTSFNENDIVTLPTPIRENFEFVGWYMNDELVTTIANQDYQLVAKWERVYKIEYNINGGSLPIDVITSFKDAESVTLPTPIRENFEFIGWYMNDELVTTIANQDYQLVAKWERVYKIEYNINGGSLPIDVITSFKDAESVTLPIPTKENNRFVGWYMNDELVTTITNQDYQLVAKWERVYTINYITNGGILSSDARTTFEESDEFTLDAPKREGYIFLGWYDNNRFSGNAIEFVPKGTTNDLKLYAYFKKKYNITYVIEEGAMPEEYITYYIPGNEDILPIAVRNGYKFLGWSERPNTTTTISNIPISYEKDLKLYAQWEKITYQITYHLSNQLYTDKEHLFISFFTDFYNYIIEYRNGEEYLISKNVKSVRDFLGIAGNWNGGVAGMGLIGNLAGNYYLRGEIGGKLEDQTSDDGFIGYCLENNKYVELVYFLQEFFYWWRLDEGYTTPGNNGSDFLADSWASLVDTAKFFYFDKDTLPSYFIKKGHIPEMYDRIPYILSKENAELSYVYDWELGLELPKNLQMEGYRFLGWYDNEELVGEPISFIEPGIYHDIILYAKIEKLLYVELETKGGELDNNKIYFSSDEVLVLPKPTRQGYTFIGWYKNENTSGIAISLINGETENLKLYAAWKKRSYTVTYNFSIDVYQSKKSLFNAFFSEFYNYITIYRNSKNRLTSNGIYTVDDFLYVASTWESGRGEMRHIGDIAGDFYLKKDIGGNIENQTSDDGFIGYCLENNKFVKLVYFLQEFFYWWRLDEGYTTPTNNGSDFLADRWASLVDTAKFFYFDKDTLPSYFIKKEHVPLMYDKIPHLIDLSNVKLVKVYDWEKGLDIPQNLVLEGYQFIGWYDNKEFIGEKIIRLDTNIYQNITLYAKWEKVE